MVKIKKASAQIWRAKLNQPFKIATGAHSILENVLLSIELEDGTKGYGEAPVATHITGETVEQTLVNLKACAKALQGHDIFDYEDFYPFWKKLFKKNNCAMAAAEMAVFDAVTKRLKMPFWKCFGNGEKPEVLKTDLTIVVGSPEEAEKAAQKINRLGIQTFKVKIGKNPELDLERVQRIVKASPLSRIYLGANQGFDVVSILKLIDDLKQIKIIPDLIEQPVPKNDVKGLVEVSRRTKVTICADESASSPEDVQRLVDEGFRGAINIKFVKFGIHGARKAVSIAKAAGLKLMMGVMMESPLATTAAAHFAAGIGGFDYIDLDSPYFMKEKITRGYSIGQFGVYDLRKIKAGIGVEPRL